MVDKEYVYQRNIRVIEKFYGSDFYKYLDDLKENDLKMPIINTIYKDPDTYDEQLYVELARKLISSENPDEFVKKIHGAYTLSYQIDDSEKVKLSSDAVCGWKQLYKLRKGDVSWLDDYEAMRKYKASYFVWPKHDIPTINTLRYAVFKDRVDYTLFDISNFFGFKKIFDKDKNQEEFEKNIEECKLGRAYLNKNGTNSWLLTFDGFEDFINKMCLKRFVYPNYKVKNIETLSEMSDGNISYDFNEDYLKNLKNIVASNEKMMIAK